LRHLFAALNTPTTADAGYYLRVVATGTGNYEGTPGNTLTNDLTRVLTTTPANEIVAYIESVLPTSAAPAVATSIVPHSTTAVVPFSTSAVSLSTNTPYALAAIDTTTQQLTSSTDVASAKPGESITLNVFHEILNRNPDYLATGVGLTVYYDSDFVEYQSGTYFPSGAVGTISHNAETHTVVIGWNDMNANWPGNAGLVELLSLSFIVKADASEGEAIFRVEGNNATPGFDLINPDEMIVAIERGDGQDISVVERNANGSGL